MMRITQEDMDHILRVTNRKLGTDYIYARADEGICVETSDNSRKISRRLARDPLYRWLEAFNDGIDAMEQKIEREAAEQAERARVNAMCNGYTNWETWHAQLVVDNDEGLYNDRDEWIERCLDLEMTPSEMAEEMATTDFYQEAIIQTAGDSSSITHVTQEVNWLELAQDSVSDWNERQAYEAKRIKEKAIKAAEKFNNWGNE